MKTDILNSLIVTVFILFSYNCKAQLTPQPAPEQLIIGTWIHENELDNKWQFMTNDLCIWLDENNNIDDTFTYSILYTSPQCGYDMQTNGNQFYYLELVNQEGDDYCYQIGVDNKALSINYLGSLGYDLFNKL